MPHRPDVPCAGGCGKLLWRSITSLPVGQATCQDCRKKKRQDACEQCGGALRGEVKGRRYCSRICANRASGKLRDSGQRWCVCEICGEPYQRQGGWPTRTCSRACGVVLRRTVTGTLTASAKEKLLVSRIWIKPCSECGRTFVARQARTLTCSKACSYQRGKQSTIDRYHNDPTFRDQVLASSHGRRADKLGLGGGKVVLLTYLCERDRWRCGICHKPIRAKRGPMRPSIDHIVPLTCGGIHELANVQAAHYRCNLSKHNGGGGEQLLLIG